MKLNVENILIRIFAIIIIILLIPGYIVMWFLYFIYKNFMIFGKEDNGNERFS